MYPNPLKIALDLERMRQEHGIGVTEIARRVGMSVPRVSQVLSLLRLTPAVLDTLTRYGEQLPVRVSEVQLRMLVHLQSAEQIKRFHQLFPVERI